MSLHTVCLVLTVLWAASVQGARTKCYQIFNEKQCFSTSSPFTNTLGKAPESPAEQRVTFSLYTPKNTRSAQLLNGGNPKSIASSRLNPNKMIRVIIHGFRDRGNKAWVKTMTKELLKTDGSNVIVVDWEKGAMKSFLNYFQAAANTRVIGAMLAKMVKIISTSKKISYNRFHLIGHSLGAHIAGYAGRRLSGQIGRISGLDPAGPAFEKFKEPVRLDRGDAKFVDVIHTDGDKLIKGGAGTLKPMGDADFYPNGGRNQPGCSQKFIDHVKNWFRGGFKGLTMSISCDHMRSIAFYTESINTSCTFRACGSTGCSRMGFHASPSKKGSFSLKTNSKSKFCKN
ncbi:pancreatic triacylglycerol lipase-like [Liolophura sinensis]|uniref:pancreatic triacylglycerol lipase-like n=1 Tax=Liolophura sinensis TaxID=3198878 RepID=UPI0031582C29